ncbi:MAG: amidase [SAR202 cluster bacterium]|nr:amidase [SAR202 cluster bacterium]
MVVNDTLNAFCKDTDAYLEGAPNGPLSGLTFAAKDIYDVAGHVTGGGNPDWKRTHGPATKTSWIVRVLVEAGATMVGKTHTDELTRGIAGENVHYGTPVNPRAPGRVPGGSSSGSASAVAGGLVDFALGSDTGGSVRIPASFCGLYGLRPTHNRIVLDGIMYQAPGYDTIGWFTRDAETFARVGEVALQTTIGGALPSRIVIAEDAFEVADPRVSKALRPAVEKVTSLIGPSRSERLSPNGLDEWSHQQQVLQGREAWETAGEWIEKTNPRFSFEVSLRYMSARGLSAQDVEEAKATRKTILARMSEVLKDGTVVCLPTAPVPAPLTGRRLSVRQAIGRDLTKLTCIAGTLSAPQINLPLAELDGLPVGLSLLGPRGSDEMLIATARKLAASG